MLLAAHRRRRHHHHYCGRSRRRQHCALLLAGSVCFYHILAKGITTPGYCFNHYRYRTLSLPPSLYKFSPERKMKISQYASPALFVMFSVNACLCVFVCFHFPQNPPIHPHSHVVFQRVIGTNWTNIQTSKRKKKSTPTITFKFSLKYTNTHTI